MVLHLGQIPPGARVYTGDLDQPDRDKIGTLLESLSCRSLGWLGWNQSKMEEYRVTLNHVHPLSFLQHSLLDNTKCKHLEKLSKRSKVIWTPFTDGIKKKLNLEDKKANVNPYIAQFAKAIGLPESEVDHLVSKRKITELVVAGLEAKKAKPVGSYVSSFSSGITNSIHSLFLSIFSIS